MNRPPDQRPQRIKITMLLLVVVFVGAAATSNWFVQNVGQDNGPFAPRTIPVGWGLHAASGVLLIGAMISVRDALHEQMGVKGILSIIVVASVFSALFAPAPIAVASGVTMLTAEATDSLVYQRLRQRGYFVAAATSNVASSLIDSALFLLVAYGVTAMLHGAYSLAVGKVEASLITIALLAGGMRWFRPRLPARTPKHLDIPHPPPEKDHPGL